MIHQRYSTHLLDDDKMKTPSDEMFDMFGPDRSLEYSDEELNAVTTTEVIKTTFKVSQMKPVCYKFSRIEGLMRFFAVDSTAVDLWYYIRYKLCGILSPPQIISCRVCF